MRFDDLALHPTILANVAAEGYSSPTAIQSQAIPFLLDGRDLVGLAQTGTGKTAAFALPILHRLTKAPRPQGRRPTRVLVLAPTRELAAQINDSFGSYGRGLGLRHEVIFGGVGQDKQVRALNAGLDVLVATPGRLLDLADQGHVDLRQLEVFVLDEADRMLDMGFIHDVRKVIARLPDRRQTLLFSATMPPEVQALADRLLKDPARVEVHPVSSTAERIQQSVYFVEKGDKRALLEHLLGDSAIRRALVFTRTKHGANRVAEYLEKASITAAAIHGNKSQSARERALSGFASGQTRVLVATDIAARGIDIEEITHVINFDLPNVPESYVHRIGRTARAGASGKALSFCDIEEREYLADIERVIGQRVPRIDEHPYRSTVPMSEKAPPRPPQQQGQRQRHGGGRGGSGGGHKQGGAGHKQGGGAPRAKAPSNAPRQSGTRQHAAPRGSRSGGRA